MFRQHFLFPDTLALLKTDSWNRACFVCFFAQEPCGYEHYFFGIWVLCKSTIFFSPRHFGRVEWRRRGFFVCVLSQKRLLDTRIMCVGLFFCTRSLKRRARCWSLLVGIYTSLFVGIYKCRLVGMYWTLLAF